MLKLKCQFPAEDFGHITCSKEQSDDHGHSVLTWQEVCYQNAFILKQKCSNKTQWMQTSKAHSNLDVGVTLNSSGN